MTRRTVFAALFVALGTLLAACGNFGGRDGYTPVTISAGNTKAAAMAPKALRKAMPAVTTITFTISGPGMTTETHTVSVTPPQTITKTFNIITGPQRTIAIVAADSGGTPLFQGSATTDLNGTPVVLPIPLQVTSAVFSSVIGTDSVDEAAAMVRDANGDVIIAGHTYGDLGGPNADPTRQTTDIFVTKLSSTGATLWTRQTGAAGMDVCYSATTDSAGNIYLAGSTDGQLPGAARTGLIDAFVMKVSPAGAVLWTTQTGTAGASTFGNAVAVDAAGNVSAAGDTNGMLDRDPHAGGYDIFVARYAADGAKQWITQFGTSSDDYGEGLAVDAGGADLFVAGTTGGDLDGQGPGTNNGLGDLYAARLDASGVVLTIDQRGTADLDQGLAIALDQATNSVTIAGLTYGGLDGNTNPDATGTTADIVVVRYTYSAVSGAIAWSWTRQLGTTGNDAAHALAVGPLGNIVVTGMTNGPSSQGGTDYDIMTARYSSQGNALWGGPGYQRYGTTADDEGRGVLVDGIGDILILGNTRGAFSPSISQDVILLRYDANGNKL